MYTNGMSPMHPGEYLREEFLIPEGISANKFAMMLRVPTTRITEILHERRSVTAETAIRLAECLGTTSTFWMNMQAAYDLRVAEIELKKSIKREVKPYHPVHAVAAAKNINTKASSTAKVSGRSAGTVVKPGRHSATSVTILVTPKKKTTKHREREYA